MLQLTVGCWASPLESAVRVGSALRVTAVVVNPRLGPAMEARITAERGLSLVPTMVLKNARILDVDAGVVRDVQDVAIADGKVEEVASRISAGGREEIDLAGRILMPGLCDAHVHAVTPAEGFREQATWSPYYTAIRSIPMLKRMLMNGFTTVRDCGGAEYGMAQALAEGWIEGPRLLYCGKALSQTGGHGDLRFGSEVGEPENMWTPGLGRVCDGVAEVRRAARDEIRRGAHHIKIMVNGGIASYTDPVSHEQFSEEEILAAVQEAAAAGKYVSAHAYTPHSIERAVRHGVRSIEHGNYLDDAAAILMAEHGAFLVPTLIILKVMADHGLPNGMDPVLHAKIDAVWSVGSRHLEVAQRNGVKIVFATDLGGHDGFDWQNEEFRIRAGVIDPVEQIRAATLYAAELFQLEGSIGQVKEGFEADLIAIEGGDPLEDVGVLADPDRNFSLIMKGGRVCKRQL